MSRSLSVAASILLLASCSGGAATTRESGSAERQAMLAKIDSIVNARITNGKAAGASVAVVRGSDTLVLRGYGMADLEFEVPTPPDAVYEIGSVTKQFTAVAIMQLVEQGKLSLDDDLTKYLPDYPTRGNRIPVRRLLDHTSGIKGYTEMPEFGRLMIQKLPKDTLVKLFSRAPTDFAPGEAEVYNNSAYFLAGLIIEKVSGMSYADYVQKNLFEKVGMANSQYCSEREIVKRRANGYDPADSTGRLVRAAYLDHTWPYAAGSLCSTAGDLVKWNQALHGGRVLSPEAYAELIRPDTLNDGTPLRYAKGLALVPLAGRPAIWHDGGINGFISLNRYLPQDSLSVVVLWNSTGEDLDVGEDIIEAVLGPAPSRAVDFTGSLEEYAGTWKGTGRGRPLEIVLAADSGRLTMKQGRGQPEALTFVGNDTWERGGTVLKFERRNGKLSRLRFDAGYLYAYASRSLVASR